MKFPIIFTFFIFVLTKKINFDRVRKEVVFANFLNLEFNYTSFLWKADHTAEKYVPFQDSSNDTYFRVGLVHKSELENYTKMKMEDHLGSIKNKPWVPIKEIRKEFVNCGLFKYGSYSQHDFKYDKGMYGWMNIMKFSCFSMTDEYFVFAMAFARTRFRLKQVYLRRQNKFWATSSRSLITRDVQKITEIFTIRFSIFVNEKLNDELKKHKIENNGNLDENPMKISNETFDELTVAFGRLRKHTKLAESRGHTFSSLAVRIKSRIMLTLPTNAEQAVEAISDELTDDPLKVLDTCHKDICSYDNMKNTIYNNKSEMYSFLKENALIHTVHPRYSLIAYQVSKPSFIFETMKRRTVTKIVDVKQHFDEKAKKLWNDLLDQQFTLAMHAHNIGIFPFEKKRETTYKNELFLL